jgi:hypothetical protein
MDLMMALLLRDPFSTSLRDSDKAEYQQAVFSISIPFSFFARKLNFILCFEHFSTDTCLPLWNKKTIVEVEENNVPALYYRTDTH